MSLCRIVLRVKKKLTNSSIRKTVNNAKWLISDKSFSMLLGVFVMAIVARYFGPEQFGELNFALAFVSLFTAISVLGMETLTVKAIVDKKFSEGTILFTSLLLRLLSGITITILTMIIINIIEPDNVSIHILVLILSFSMVVKSFEVIEYWIQAYQKAKISSIIRMSVYVVIATMKILLVVFQGSLIQYALIYTLDTTLVAIALTIAYFKFRDQDTPWKFSFKYAKCILSQSWYLILSGLMVTLYMRIDQVMLGSMMSTKKEVGIYSAAVRIAEMWYFIPMAIITSFKPVIMKNKNLNKKKYNSSIQFLFTTILWISIGFGLLILFLSKPLILVLYGNDFLDAVSILIISVWAGTFALLGSARAVWLVTEGLQKYTLIFMMSGAIVNIILNLILIPQFGAQGAAIATLISQIIVVIVVPLFYQNTRQVTVMILKSFVFKK